jgi:hypothetical protein
VTRRTITLLSASAAASLTLAACGSYDEGAPAAAASSARQTDELALGKRAVSPFVDYGTPNQSKSTKVAVKVLRVRRGRISDFKHFNLNRRQRRSVPYYVDARFENLGRFALSRSLLRPSVEDADGREYRPANLVVLGGTFKPCPSYPASKLRPGADFTGCSAILLPKGTELGRVRFQGDVGREPLFWQAS